MGQIPIEEARTIVMERAGLDPNDFNDLPIQQLIGVFDEVKATLYGSESDNSSSSSSEHESSDEAVSNESGSEMDVS